MALVAVAMSGGVDSSVAAALLREQGHEVVGLTMLLHGGCDDAGRARGRACCTREDVRDAAAVAARLGCAFHTVDFRAAFREHVIAPFVAAYVDGRTPNPCIPCNHVLKFEWLLRAARDMGAAALATGHYARLTAAGGGSRFELRRGRDPRKDQSYFLYGTPRAALPFVRFPLGELSKGEVRQLAAAHGLAVADKRESQEACFVAEGGVAEFVAREAGATLRGPGPIVDREGRVLGRHRGLHAYTVGQRHGLGLSRPAPLYVHALDVAGNRLLVGDRDGCCATRLVATAAHWLDGAPPAQHFRATAQVRYRHAAAPATVAVEGDGFTLEFEAPELAVAPGQAVVLYDGDRVLGGGAITWAGGSA